MICVPCIILYFYTRLYNIFHISCLLLIKFICIPAAIDKNIKQIVAEFLGTYILIFTGCGAAMVDRDRPLTIIGIAMVWGLCLIALIYTLGHVSGAHFNPAVSIAFAVTGRLRIIQVSIRKNILVRFIIILLSYLLTMVII